MIKIVILNMLLLVATSSYNMDGAASRPLSQYEELIQHIIECYRIDEQEALRLLEFCNDLQCTEDFKKHELRQDFEYHLRNLLRNKKKQSPSVCSKDI